MCGIAGVLRIHPAGAPPPPPDAAIPEAWLDILDDSIMHRGPDGQGRFRDRAIRPDGSVVDVALVHRRLAIIDPATGHQPMVWSADRSLWRDAVNQRARSVIAGWDSPATATGERRPLARGSSSDDLIAVVFNGCIYNHRELRNQLETAGHRFETDHSDTEVLVHGWREWGYELPTRLDGMFAFLIWDRARGELVIVRDRYGEKPLYFRDRWDPPFTLAISSTVPGLCLLPFGLDDRHSAAPVPRALEHVRREWVRFGYCRLPPFPALGVIEPGNLCGAGTDRPDANVKGLRVWARGSSWWRTWRPPDALRTWHPAVDHIDSLLDSAVKERLDADVPLGSFLSGGIDSALVTAHAKRHRPDIEAFTVRMPDPHMDESSAARATAESLGVRHTVLDCHAHPADDLVALIHQLGLPFGDSSLLPTYWVCRAAAQKVRVALSGDGADELFAGYERYRAAHLLGCLGIFRHLLWPLALALTPGDRPDSPAALRFRFFNAAVRDGYADLNSIFPEPTPTMLGLRNRLPAPARAILHGIGVLRDVFSSLTEWATQQRVAGAMDSDVALYLPEDILRKTDTASMAVPLEVRAPFLDSELATTARQIRISHLMPRGQRKGLLRQVARKYLPAEIVDRPKQGFAIPIGEWFRSDYGGMKTLLMDHLNSAEPWGPPSLGINLNMKFIRQMLDEHLGTGMSGRVTRDHSQRLYMLLVLSIWAKWLGGLR